MVSAGRNGGDVDVEPHQLLHRARVLGTVQPLERTPARIGRRAASASIRFSSGDARRASCASSGRRAPAGGIMPGPQLADHLLGGLDRMPPHWPASTPAARDRRPWRGRCGTLAQDRATISACAAGANALGWRQPRAETRGLGPACRPGGRASARPITTRSLGRRPSQTSRRDIEDESVPTVIRKYTGAARGQPPRNCLTCGRTSPGAHAALQRDEAAEDRWPSACRRRPPTTAPANPTTNGFRPTPLNTSSWC